MKTIAPTLDSELPETKRKLVDAGVSLMRKHGFNATTVDEICAVAGVTKGGFFHYFKSKQEVAEAALLRFQQIKANEFEAATFRSLQDPLERVFGWLDFAEASSGGAAGQTKGCLIGMFAQELAFTNPELRKSCEEAFAHLTEDFEKDLVEAKSLYAPKADFIPKNVATLYVTIVQGSQLLTKTAGVNLALSENLKDTAVTLKGCLGGRAARPTGRGND